MKIITKPFKQKVNLDPAITNIDNEYLALCQYILNNGTLTENRTGVKTYATTGLSIRHNMDLGFPILTTKKVAWKTLKVELEGFLKGVTSKAWFQERGCHIWDEWCNPQKVPYGNDEETKRKMKEEDDLGLIYGSQWRDFKDPVYANDNPVHSVDQLAKVLHSLKHNPEDRRIICSAWNPLALDRMALPPCHLMWLVNVIDGKLCLDWIQRSCDFFLGIPFNIASYALLLHLLAQQFELKEGILTGHFINAHIYENHVDQIKEQMTREPRGPVRIETEPFDDIRNWNYTMSELVGYDPHPPIKGEVAV